MRWQGLSLEGMPRAAPKDLALLEPDRWSAGHLEAVSCDRKLQGAIVKCNSNLPIRSSGPSVTS